MSGIVLHLRGPALILSAAVAVSCGGQAAANSESTENQQTEGQQEEVGRIINVEVTEAESGAFTELIRVTGSVQANRDIMVSAEEGGVIREILVDKGARVQAGEPIARVDDRLLTSQVAQAKAQADLAAEVWERRKRLYEVDKVGTELAYLEAKYGAEQAKANHELLAERLSRTVIRAPISGVLESRSVETGSMVATGTPVVRIVQLDTVKISGGVPERYAPDITRGTSVRVTFDVLPGREFNGRVMYAGSTVNPRNRTFPIELSIANPGNAIKPEMVANIEAVRRTLESTISLPQEALVRVEGGFVVFVVASDAGGVERAQARRVETGPAQRNRVSIDSGVVAGDRVVIVGQNQLADGDRVRIVRTVTGNSAMPSSPGRTPAGGAGGEE